MTYGDSHQPPAAGTWPPGNFFMRDLMCQVAVVVLMLVAGDDPSATQRCMLRTVHAPAVGFLRGV
jgi:hypothetical protein